jgi:hypothetical protein
MDEDQVQDATIIEENKEDEYFKKAGADAAEEIINVEDAIKTRIVKLDELREKMRKQKEMLESFLAQEPKYQEHLRLAKEANKLKNTTKARLLQQPESKNLVETVKSLKEEQKELQDGLSYYLLEYRRMTGANEFEGSDGELREIVYVAKLVRKSPLKR